MKRWLGCPALFGAFNRLIGAARARTILARRYIRARDGQRVLDIGCGTAELLTYLPRVDYTGFDVSPSYIARARRRYGDRGTFLCRSVSAADAPSLGTFDLVLATGVLHHLSDEEARRLFALARAAMTAAGRLVTFDGCYRPRQSWVARALLAADRGAFVRTEEEYRRLAAPFFSDVRSALHDDLLRLPYTHVILECARPTAL
jgi:cyclopropane fatty-acyl-phospholipid synthase-like methyltransferase